MVSVHSFGSPAGAASGAGGAARLLEHGRSDAPRLQTKHLLALEGIRQCRGEGDDPAALWRLRALTHHLRHFRHLRRLRIERLGRGRLWRRAGSRIRLDAVAFRSRVEQHGSPEIALVERDDTWELHALTSALKICSVLRDLRALCEGGGQLDARRRRWWRRRWFHLWRRHRYRRGGGRLLGGGPGLRLGAISHDGRR
jgi:hypothetical protein